MTLLELQRRMAADVMRPLTDGFEMQPEAEDSVAGYIKPNDRLSSFDRLEIYNKQYWLRIIGAVSEDYPALQALVGEKIFDRMVLAYVRENPSTSFTLRNMGAKLPEWLAAHAEFAPRRHDLMLDVARLEWAYVEAFDSASVAPLTPEDFAELNAESKLSLQPHLQLLDLKHPVDELVLAVHRATAPSEVVSNAVTERREVARVSLPKMRRKAVYLAVHRFENSVYYRRIDREALLLLAALKKGEALGDALASAFSGSRMKPEQQAAKIQEYFAHAAELGWFCKQSSTPPMPR